MNNGRDSDDKNAIEDIAAKNCFQADLIVSTALGNSCCEFGHGRANSHNNGANNEFILRLAIFFGTDAQSWMNLQTHYDLTVAEEKLSDRLKKEVVRYAA